MSFVPSIIALSAMAVVALVITLARGGATHWLIAVHLSVSVAVHLWILVVGSHEVLSVFPHGYSYLALAYFGFFAWRSWTLRLRPA
jgi:hypothetical protein